MAASENHTSIHHTINGQKDMMVTCAFNQLGNTRTHALTQTSDSVHTLLCTKKMRGKQETVEGTNTKEDLTKEGKKQIERRDCVRV